MTGSYNRFGSGSEEYFRQLITGGDIEVQPEEAPGIMSRSRFAGRGAPVAMVTSPEQPAAPSMSFFENFAKWLGRSSDDPERLADAVLNVSPPVRPTGGLDDWENMPALDTVLASSPDQTREALGSTPTTPQEKPPAEEPQTFVQSGSYMDQINSNVPDELQRAVLIGTMQTEVGDEGPIEENPNYTLNRAYEIFADSKVDRALASLSPAEQERVRAGRTSRELGMTIFEQNYEGGAAYRGRGLIQLTHRSNYQAVQDKLAEQGLDVDLVNNPELANDPQYVVPVALAYLEVAGITEEGVQSLGPATLNNIVNPGISRRVAEERWSNIVNSLRNSGQDELADRMQNRNEWRAQATVGTKVDGKIGPNSISAMRRWLRRNNVSIPEGASNIDLVELVNRNS